VGEGLLHVVSPAAGHLQAGRVRVDEHAQEGEQVALDVHQRGPPALAGLQALDVVAQEVVEELQARRAGDGEDGPVGEDDEGRGRPLRHALSPSSAGRWSRGAYGGSSACSSSTARIDSINRRGGDVVYRRYRTISE
jgi:hypothetical protein